LQPEVQQIVASGKLSAGHARALIGIKDADRQKNIAYSVIAEGWTVRQIEKAVRDISQGAADRQEKPPAPPVDPNVRAAIDEMQRALGTRVRVVERAKGKGHIEIEYYSPDDLDRIYGIITNSA
jgi:ParB family chromosome partitioning protein